MKTSAVIVLQTAAYAAPAVNRFDVKVERGFAESARSKLPDLGYEQIPGEF